MKHRKLLSVLLALVMLLQLVPGAAFASGEGAADGTPAYAGAQEDDPAAPTDGEAGTDPAAPTDGETGTDPAAPTDGETGTDPAAPADEGAAYGLRALDAPLTETSGHLTISGDTSYIVNDGNDVNGKYKLSDVSGKQIIVEYKNDAGAADGTVVVIECFEYGATFDGYENYANGASCGNITGDNGPVAEIIKLDDHRLALVLARNVKSFTIDLVMAAKALTYDQAVYIIDNDDGVPTTRIAAAERESINSIGAPDPSDAVLCSAQPYFSDPTITQTHAYDYAVSALAPITDNMLWHKKSGTSIRDFTYQSLQDPKHQTVALRYQLPDIKDGGALMEIQSIKLYAPSDKLKLDSVQSNQSVQSDGDDFLDELKIAATDEVDFWWDDWAISGPMTEGDDEYYLLTPPTETRVFNTKQYAAFYPIWQLKDRHDPLPSDSDSSDGLAYTPFEAADTVITYKLPGDNTEYTATLDDSGAKLYTFPQQPRDVEIKYNPMRKSDSAQRSVVMGAQYNDSASLKKKNLFLDVYNSSYITTEPVRTDYVPTHTGAVTQTFVFPYEIQPTALMLDGSRYINASNSYHLTSTQRVLPGGAEKTIKSITYWTKEEVDADNNPIGDGHTVDVMHSDATDNAHPAVDGNGTYGFTDNSITSDNPVKIVKIKWSCLANENRWWNVYNSYDDRETEKVYFNYKVSETDENGDDINGKQVQVTFTQDYGDSGYTGGPETPNENYLYFRLTNIMDPQLIGVDVYPTTRTDTANGINYTYFYSNIAREDEFVLGDVGLYIGEVGEYKESLENPVIDLSTQIRITEGTPDLTGITDEQCLAMLTGEFTAMPRLKGWTFVYTTKNNSGEQTYTVLGDIPEEGRTEQILDAGDYFTSLKLKYDGTFVTRHESDDQNVIWLMKNINLKDLSHNPFDGEEIKTSEDNSIAYVYLGGLLTHGTTDATDVQDMKALGAVSGSLEDINSLPNARMWCTRRAELQLYGQESTEYSTINITENSDRSVIPVWTIDVSAKADRYALYHNKSTAAGVYMPWEEIREAVYVELTDPAFTVDLTKTEFFGYPVDGETVKSETVTVTDADGTKHTFLKLWFAYPEGFIREKYMLKDGTPYTTNTALYGWHQAIGALKIVASVSGWSTGSASSKPRPENATNVGGKLKLGLTAKDTIYGNVHHPVGDIYFDFSELLAKYHASVKEDPANRSGCDLNRTYYEFKDMNKNDGVTIEEDKYGLSPTSSEDTAPTSVVTGAKLFKINGRNADGSSKYTVFVNGAGGDLVDGGTLKITKTATGAQVPADTIFTITGTPTTEGVTFETVTVTYEDFTDGVYTLDVPFGKYTVTEDTDSAAVAGYTLTVSGNGEEQQIDKGETVEFAIENTYVELVTISGEKTWADDDNRDGSRPDSITINLMHGNTTVESKRVTADDNWAWSFTVPKNENGQAINYTITEEPVAGYTATVDGYNVTNTHEIETVTISGAKTWADDNNRDGSRPASITINLMNGDTTVASKAVTANDNWAWSFTVPKNENGQAINYTITEEPVAGYTATVDGYDVTNTRDLGTLKIVKTATGAQVPAGTTFTISGAPIAGKFETVTVTYADFTDGVYTLENVPTGTYTVTEDVDGAAVAGYTLTVSGNGETMTLEKGETAEFSIENAYELDLGTLRITKTVTGTTMPGDVAFTISGTPVAADVTFETRTVRYADFENGVYTLENVPTGTYTVTEDVDGAAVDGYTLTVSGNEETMTLGKGETVEFAIENAYELDRGTLQIVKKTEGAQTPDGTRFTITGTPVAKDVTFETRTVRYADFENGVYTLENVPTGTYTVTEDVDGAALVGYKLTVTGDNGATKTLEKNGTVKFTITNKYEHTTPVIPVDPTPTPTPTPVPEGLNGSDHFAYIVGYPDGTVQPGKNITRAEVATIFFRLLKDEVRAANVVTTNTFSDVSEDAWYNRAVSTMAKLGIVNGYPDGSFKPYENITRAEFAAIAARFDEKTDARPANFSDVAGHWASVEIAKAAANGWINGYPDGTFKPDQKITRAESMALINRVLMRDPERPEDLLPNMNKWPDNMDTSKWYYLDVQEATNSHEYERVSKPTETWTAMRDDPDWTVYER